MKSWIAVKLELIILSSLHNFLPTYYIEMYLNQGVYSYS